MRRWWLKIKNFQLSFLSVVTLVSTAHAHTRHHSVAHVTHHDFSHHKARRRVETRRMALESTPHHAHAHRYMRLAMMYRRHHHHFRGHVIQCVAYAKHVSGIMLRGNARDWWYNAAGIYDRGHVPEPGSILNFRGTRRMPLGHVAVVRNVIDSRTITVDQSHWAQAGVSHNVNVVDVSLNNDWSAVRVSLNHHSKTYGSVYPTYGFIYPHRNAIHVAWNNRSKAYSSVVPMDGFMASASHHNANAIFLNTNQKGYDDLGNKT
ncbi:MAG: CHAP domain-containing protein [Acetobacter sp.]|nr:CHAP domain-containing protein [Acetobacter sp.]